MEKGSKNIYVVIILGIIAILFWLNQSNERYPFHVFGYKLGDTFYGDGLDTTQLGNYGYLFKSVKPKEFFRRFDEYIIRVTPNKHKVCGLQMIARFTNKDAFKEELEAVKSLMKTTFGDVKEQKTELDNGFETYVRIYNKTPKTSLDIGEEFGQYLIGLRITDLAILKED